MTNLDAKDSTDEGSTAFVLALQRMGDPVKSLWEWLEREPERLNMFAHAMEGVGECDISGRCRGVVNTARTGYIGIAAIKADYPWESLPPNTTFVDVGAGQGSAALHILRHVYKTVPTLKVVLQDYAGPLERGRQFWSEEFPEALADRRVEFEPHNFFDENPRKGPNTVYWFRFIMR